MKKIYALLVMIMILLGCNDNDIYENTQQIQYTSINLSIYSVDIVETRSIATENEKVINDLFVLAFDANGNVKGIDLIDIGKNVINKDGDLYTIKTLINVSVNDKVVVLINTGYGPEDMPYLEQIKTYSDINNYFSSERWNYGVEGRDAGKGIPMSGMKVWSKNASENLILIKRSMAKIQLALSLNLEVYDGVEPLDSDMRWTLVNYPTVGHILLSNPTQSSELDIPNDEKLKFSEVIDFKCYPMDNNNPIIFQQFYIPEYPTNIKAKLASVPQNTFNKDRACILIKNKNKYYRLDLGIKNAGSHYIWYPIKRNSHYIITIKKVYSNGYDTVEEALNNLASNFDYEYTFVEYGNNIIISNNQYGVELEYDRLVMYANVGDTASIKVRMFTMYPPATTLKNKITYEGVINTNSINTLDTKEQSLKFSVGNQNGTIKIQLGNITKTISIVKQSVFDAHYEKRSILGVYDSFVWEMNSNFNYSFNRDGSFNLLCNNNITPIKWINPMNGENTTHHHVNAEPIFENKNAIGYLIDSRKLMHRSKIIVSQRAPDYVGWSGGVPNSNGDTYFSKRMIVESREEQFTIPWSKTQVTGYKNPDTGLANTSLMVTNDPNNNIFNAAWYCWMKNDKNYNGVIEPEEVADNPWYLPSSNQLICMWVSYPNFNYSMQSGGLYWSSNESNLDNTNAMLSRFSYGNMHYGKKSVGYSVRCVKDL